MNPEAEILLRDCEDHFGLGDFAAILERCEPLLASGDPDLKLIAHLGMVEGLFGAGRFEESRTVLHAAFDLRETASPEAAVEAICAYAAHLRTSYSNVLEADELYEQARMLALSAKYKRGYALATVGAGAIMAMIKPGGQAVRLLELGRDEARRDRAITAELLAWNELGVYYQTHRKIAQALEAFQTMIKRAQLFNRRPLELIGLSNLGYTMALNGGFREFEQTIAYCEEAVRMAQDLNYLYGEMAALRSLGMALELSDPARAVEPFERVLSLARQSDYKFLVAEMSGKLAHIAVTTKDYVRVQTYLDDLLLIHADTLRGDVKDYAAAMTLQHIARLYRTLGDYHQSAVYWRRSLHMIRQLGYNNPFKLGIWYIALGLYELADFIHTLTGAKARRKRKQQT